MNVIKPPSIITIPKGNKSVFLAGSIEMGVAELWADRIIDSFDESDNITFLNPRRDDWDCVDIETKAMTRYGLKSHDELSIGDEILTYNTSLNLLEYSKVNKINTYDLEDEEILEFKRNKDKFYFTKNHRMLSRKSSRDNSVNFYDASHWIDKKDSVRIPCGKFILGNDDNILLGNEFKDEHFKLYGWLLSEGSIFKRNDCNTYNIVIAQYIKNEYKVNKIKSILEELSINFRYDGRQFTLDKDGVDFIFGFMGFEKYKIPEWIKKADKNQKRIFILEYGLGDGSYIDDELIYVAFSEKYRDFAIEFQILCFECGISTKLRNKTSGFGFPVINIATHNFDKLWYTMKYSSTVRYSGKVWCPTTDNGTWVAYRNGTPFITGNSSWKQDISNNQFRWQVQWELEGLERADLIVLYLQPGTMSPISLLELGLFARDHKMVICCPDGFWRQGNVDIVAQRYYIKQVDNIDDLIKSIKYMI